MLGQAKQPVSIHYFNCTEGGILGVMSRSTNPDNMNKPDNWYLLDEVCPIYHTAMFEDAVLEYLKAKELMEKNQEENQWQEKTKSQPQGVPKCKQIRVSCFR